MAYKKQYFKNGNVLTAEQLNHMEDGIVEAAKTGGSGPSSGASLAQTYTDMTPGYVNVKTGAFGTGGNWQRTDYIPVSSGDVVTFSGRIGDNMGVAGYDENKAFVASVLDRIDEGSANTYANEPLTIPEGVAYIAGCTNSPSNPITVMVYKDAKALVDAGGGGLPEGGQPYMQLVTDGEGKAGWEQRLAWAEMIVARVALVADETTQSGSIEVNKNGVVEQVKQVDMSNDVVNNGYLRVFNEPLTVEQTKSITVPSKGFQLAGEWDSLVSAGFVNNLCIFSNYFINIFENGVDTPAGMFNNKGLYIHASIVSDPSCLFEYIDSENVKKIERKFLPISFVHVTSGVDDSGSSFVKSDKTYQEISEMIAEGIIPKCICNDVLVLELVSSSALSEVMPLASLPTHTFNIVENQTSHTINIDASDSVYYHTYRFQIAES